MNESRLRARFVDSAINTASPQRLLVLLYDRLLLDVRMAAASLDAGDRADANRCLGHAQQIVLELRAALQVDAWDGGPGLASLYAFLVSELGRAIVTGERERVSACDRLIQPLRDAWHEASSAATAPVLAATA